jgi:predicted PurR-regulated permease PerM
MARYAPTRPADRALVVLSGIIVAVVVLMVLYWARQVLIPVALAVYLAFLLTPVVTYFQRRGMPRVPAVVLVTVLSAAVVLGIGYVVISQIGGLIGELPNYHDIIKKKVDTLQDAGKDTPLTRLRVMLDDLTAPFTPNGKDRNGPPGTESGPPLHVVVEQVAPAWVHWLPGYGPTVFEFLAELALVVVLALFMLLSREDLRNRFIRVVGYGHMTVTTKAVDDASQRLSRFLLMQFVTNVSFGLFVGLGTLLLGLKYPLLWGVLGALMRYIPYIGSAGAALFPVIQCLVQFAEWWPALVVVGMIIGLELIYANVLEPYFYGQTVGVSAVALLISAAFWTFLWGPVGLVLSTPLTVCVVVLGKYVPALHFLGVLLGDQPALDEPATFYQRLSARDAEEAMRIVRDRLKTSPPKKIYDELLVPALVNAVRDHKRGGLDDADLAFVRQAIEDTIEKFEDARREQRRTELAGREAPVACGVHILGVAGRDENDALTLKMLQQLVQGGACELEIVGPEALSSELLAMVKEKEPAAICIAAVPPGGLQHARYLCKRLRKRFPRLQIMVGRWGLLGGFDNQRRSLRDAGANQIRTALLETRNDLLAWCPALLNHPGATAPLEKKGPEPDRPEPAARGLREQP